MESKINEWDGGADVTQVLSSIFLRIINREKGFIRPEKCHFKKLLILEKDVLNMFF